MKAVLRLALFAAVVAAGVWLWAIFFPSPEKIIRARITEMAHDVSFGSNENSLASLAAAQRLADFFSTNVVIDLNFRGGQDRVISGRGEVMQDAMSARSSFGELKVELPDMNISVAPDKQSATADLTVRVETSGDTDFMVTEMKLTLKKISGQWLVTHAKTVQVLT